MQDSNLICERAFNSKRKSYWTITKNQKCYWQHKPVIKILNFIMSLTNKQSSHKRVKNTSE